MLLHHLAISRAERLVCGCDEVARTKTPIDGGVVNTGQFGRLIGCQGFHQMKKFSTRTHNHHIT